MNRFIVTLTCFLFGAVCLADELVFDFETGDDGWRVVEGENTKPFGDWEKERNQPKNAYDKHGKRYLTTLETAAHNRPTDDTVCVLESPVFTLTGSEMRLLVGGGKRPNTYAGLCLVNADGSVAAPVRKAQGQDSEKLIEVVWDTAELKGKPAVLQLVDKEIGGWAHIRLDYVRTEGVIDKELTEKRNKFIALAKAAADAAVKEKAEKIRQNPLLNAHPILYVARQQYNYDHHNTETLFGNV